ncbi:hypothetical protein [Kribbella sp. NPDC055071]
MDSAFALAALAGLLGTLTAGIILVRAARRLSRAATSAPLDLSAAPSVFPGESYRLKRRPTHRVEPAEPAVPADEEAWGESENWGAAPWVVPGAPAGPAEEEDLDEQPAVPPPSPPAVRPPAPRAVDSPTADSPVVDSPVVDSPVVEDLLSALTPEQRAIVIAFRRELNAAGRQADRKALYANLLFFAAGILASILVTLLVHPL